MLIITYGPPMAVGAYGIHWFRRDLRIAGNEALQQQWKLFNGRVLGLFCFDNSFLSRSDFSVNRFQLFLDTLHALKKELREQGSDLLVLDEGPLEALPNLLTELGEQYKPSLVTWCRDYEPFARERDEKVMALLRHMAIPFENHRDHLLIEPTELEKKEGGVYQVFTPFAKKWLQTYASVSPRVSELSSALSYLQGLLQGNLRSMFQLKWHDLLSAQFIAQHEVLAAYCDANKSKVSIAIPKAGSLAAIEALSEFQFKITDYGVHRDVPGLDGSSRFSLFLKNGSLTVPLLMAYYRLAPYTKALSGAQKFLSELIWREFYYHILYHFPSVEQHAFQSAYENLAWVNDERLFEAWKEGRTGFPMVDAGMRQLSSTGWMHNRVRMIVASFLTKDLLIDWRWGEQHFMQQLLDGDLAPNNGGWQWAASTGCDAQPYFRIFNPWLQSARFDPEGHYIKKYIPELKNVPPSHLHDVNKDRGPSYPKPIIDHHEQKQKALALFQSARAKLGSMTALNTV